VLTLSYALRLLCLSEPVASPFFKTLRLLSETNVCSALVSFIAHEFVSRSLSRLRNQVARLIPSVFQGASLLNDSCRGLLPPARLRRSILLRCLALRCAAICLAVMSIGAIVRSPRASRSRFRVLASGQVWVLLSCAGRLA
jgi:hypothetical protein